MTKMTFINSSNRILITLISSVFFTTQSISQYELRNAQLTGILKDRVSVVNFHGPERKRIKANTEVILTDVARDNQGDLQIFFYANGEEHMLKSYDDLEHFQFTATSALTIMEISWLANTFPILKSWNPELNDELLMSISSQNVDLINESESDEIINYEVRNVLRILLQSFPHLNQEHFQLHILKDPEPVARYHGSGILSISTGFLAKFHSFDELAGVLAHEIGHHFYLHVRKDIIASNKAAPILETSTSAALGAIALNELINSLIDGEYGDLYVPGLWIAILANAQNSNFEQEYFDYCLRSRNDERLAENFGIQLMGLSPYSNSSYACLLDRMAIQESPRIKPSDTHPKFAERRAAINQESTCEFDTLYHRVFSDVMQDQVNYLTSTNQLLQAKEMIERLTAANIELNDLTYIKLAGLTRKLGDPEEALRILRTITSPTNSPFRIPYQRERALCTYILRTYPECINALDIYTDDLSTEIENILANRGNYVLLSREQKQYWHSVFMEQLRWAAQTKRKCG